MEYQPTSRLLGQHTAYPTQYDPRVLDPIQRSLGRGFIGDHPLPYGVDVWTAYEVSWVRPSGVPEVGIGVIEVPADSEYLIESKSLKLYLNSLNTHVATSRQALESLIATDLSAVAHAPVTVTLHDVSDPIFEVKTLSGHVLDTLKIEACVYTPTPSLLSVTDTVVSETVVSHLFRSVCPVTGQPDWASIQIGYIGPQISHEGLLRYLISYRTHAGFHEECVERVFMDILRVCEPERLSVLARFTRRGGLDINPFRSTERDLRPDFGRLSRQ